MSDEPVKSEGSLAYSDNFSISWRAVDHALDPTHLANVNASNEEFLRALSVLGDTIGQSDTQDASASSSSQDIARLDLKVNLLLDLVGTLIYHQLDIPDTSPVQLSAEEVSWQGDVPEPGRTVYLELYLQRGLPKPFCCYGEVLSTDTQFAAGNARVRFVGLTGAAKSWLEKLIFRHHRREVAFRRSSAEK